MKKCGERHYRSETSQNLTDNQKRTSTSLFCCERPHATVCGAACFLKEEKGGRRNFSAL